LGNYYECPGLAVYFAKMSRASEIKKLQGFNREAPACRNCIYFKEELICGIGGFKIKKTNHCNKHKRS